MTFNDDRTQITLTLVDGGAGDNDRETNGVIVEPSGLGTEPDGGSRHQGDDNTCCFIQTAVSGPLLKQHIPLHISFAQKTLLVALVLSLVAGGYMTLRRFKMRRVG